MSALVPVPMPVVVPHLLSNSEVFFSPKLCYYLEEAFSDNHKLGQLLHFMGSHRGLKCSFLVSIIIAVSNWSWHSQVVYELHKDCLTPTIGTVHV